MSKHWFLSLTCVLGVSCCRKIVPYKIAILNHEVIWISGNSWDCNWLFFRKHKCSATPTCSLFLWLSILRDEGTLSGPRCPLSHLPWVIALRQGRNSGGAGEESQRNVICLFIIHPSHYNVCSMQLGLCLICSKSPLLRRVYDTANCVSLYFGEKGW